MLVHREKNHGKLKPKQNLCVFFFLRSWKDLLEILPCFSGLLCELVLVTGVVTPRVNDFEGCNSASRVALHSKGQVCKEMSKQEGVCTGQCKETP